MSNIFQSENTPTSDASITVTEEDGTNKLERATKYHLAMRSAHEGQQVAQLQTNPVNPNFSIRYEPQYHTDNTLHVIS